MSGPGAGGPDAAGGVAAGGVAAGGIGAVVVPVRGGAPLTAASRLGLPRGSRLHRCAVRGRWTLLVPERVLFLCPITTEALRRLGEGTLGEVALAMAREYDAPAQVVLADLAELLAGLVERGDVRHEPG